MKDRPLTRKQIETVLDYIIALDDYRKELKLDIERLKHKKNLINKKFKKK